VLIWWWCLEYHGRLYFIVHPHCMKCCSLGHFIRLTLGHILLISRQSVIAVTPYCHKVLGLTRLGIEHTSIILEFRMLTSTPDRCCLWYTSECKKWSTFQGNIYCMAIRLFYEGRVLLFRLKIVNEFLWENVRRIEFESTQRVIRIRKSKDREHNSQKKGDKRTNNDLQSIHTKPKIT
jgi:hypothetical protein